MSILSNRLKVCLVGAGQWGWQHARVFSRRKDVHLAAVAGRNSERTLARAQEFNIQAYTDVQDMLDREHPDLVSLSLPNLDHFQATMQVIEAGYPLFVEKPLVFNLNEADRLLSEARKRGLFFAINFNHRYAKAVRLARQAIDEARLGELTHAIWRFGGEANISSHPHANLIETQCHGFDQLEHLCGPIKSVMAEMTDKTGGGYRTVTVALRFLNGAVGSLIGTYDSSYAYPDTHFLEVNGTKGMIRVDDTVQRFSFQSAGNETSQLWKAGYFDDLNRSFHHTLDLHVDALIEALRTGKEPPIHASAGRRALVLAWAAIDSFQTGKRVDCSNE
ncbi:MAG: Gfo/Idh/MocA family oxidoreductase [Verrucomicrobia bacterium]|nr:Gfo/Idh/MocA family oxidoreductase [Verrucomicrobiota bacterium]MBV9672610.1 Gfo/Idh/MocA family oxidoreductase [Verrucomicrobiota bacterium]